MPDRAQGSSMFGAATYVIVAQGALEPFWSEQLGGMAITVCEGANGPITTLTGVLIDQGALVGVLQTLYNLGLPILSVCATDTPSSPS